MRYRGYADATADPGGADNGIDVRATGAIALDRHTPGPPRLSMAP